MVRPRILIPIPTSFDEAYNQQCWPEYAAAVAAAGGEPIELRLHHSTSEVQRLAAGANGILLPGSPADVDPARYGHPRHQASAPPDPQREGTDVALLEFADLHSLPLLGICMGLQTMNSYYGGTLVQDLDPLPVNHSAGRAVHTAHTVLVEPDSRLYNIAAATAEFSLDTDGRGRFPVNSSHHQAVDIAGSSLRVTARCRQDGVVEAVEGSGPSHWLVGLQWHPERTLDTSTTSAAIFREFVRVCTASAE